MEGCSHLVRTRFLMGLFQSRVSLKMTEISPARVPASSGCHPENQADCLKSSLYLFIYSFICLTARGDVRAQWETAARRRNETRMERRRDGGVQGHREQVVRREGLMSNERLARPQLILSLHLCVPLPPPRNTEVITTPSSIILLSRLFTGNCLITCYRFVLHRIILSVICTTSCGKHTYIPQPPTPPLDPL